MTGVCRDCPYAPRRPAPPPAEERDWTEAELRVPPGLEAQVAARARELVAQGYSTWHARAQACREAKP